MSDSNFISNISQTPLFERQNDVNELVQKISLNNSKLEHLLSAVLANSPYLGRLIETNQQQLTKFFIAKPDDMMADLISELQQIQTTDKIEFAKNLRQIKTRFHLFLALLELAGVWSTQKITASLASFADTAIQRCIEFSWQKICQHSSKPLPLLADSGFFIVAFGKLGGSELNYSSDVDLAFFYQRNANNNEPTIDDRIFIRLSRELIELLNDVSKYGFVFRVDLRLRPDPSSTPIAISTDAASVYYESVGQTWERAAWIKARIIAGDQQAGADFIKQMEPFIWRKNLDFAAIEDIYQIRQQVLFGKTQQLAPNPGYNVKLGIGGIREIELFVQTLQLIHGGRKPTLRQANTLEALAKLAKINLIPQKVSNDLTDRYIFLRRVEHVLQMINDRQTHTLPTSQQQHKQVHQLLGFASKKQFEQELIICTNQVCSQTNSFFAKDVSEQSKDALHLAGYENHPDAIVQLVAAGFANASDILLRMRGWMSGHIRATRSERSRRLLAALAPDIIASLAKTPDPDAAFNSFAKFFEALPSGVQVLSLFANSPRLLTRLVDIFQMAPQLGNIMIARPNIIEVLLNVDQNDYQMGALTQEISTANDLEQAMNIARRGAQETLFSIGAELLSGGAKPQEVARVCSELATIVIDGLAARIEQQLSAKETANPIEWAVLALGKLGSCEMMPGSDLDIMVLYSATNSSAALAPDVWAARFTRRLISALSAPTSEGLLYEVDMRLRPSGQSGPIAVELSSFLNYYQQNARTWEFQALSRARIVSASSPTFAQQASDACSNILNNFVDKPLVRHDISQMRQRIKQEKPDIGLWDLKNGSGGLRELEFILQTIFLLAPASNKFQPLFQSSITQEQIICTGLINKKQFNELSKAHLLFHRILQITNMAIGRVGKGDEIPTRLQQTLIYSSGAESFSKLEEQIKNARQQITAILDHTLS